MTDRPRLRYCRWFMSDWLSSEARFSMDAIERGIYRDALDINYLEGSIPSDEGALMRRLAVTPEEFAHAWPKVSKKFEPHPDLPGRLMNPRAAQLFAEDEAYREMQAQKGRRGGRPRKKPEESRTKAVAFSGLKPNESRTKSREKAPISTSTSTSTSNTSSNAEIEGQRRSSTSGQRFAGREGGDTKSPTRNGKPPKAEQEARFAQWWSIWPRKVGKHKAHEAFNRKVTTDAIFQELMRLTPLWDERQFRFRDSDKVPYPATFLNGKPWEDGQDPAEIRPGTPRHGLAERMKNL